MITIEKKLPKDFGVLDLAAAFVEEVQVLNGINLATDELWNAFAYGWAISKGVGVVTAKAFVKRYAGVFSPTATSRDEA